MNRQSIAAATAIALGVALSGAAAAQTAPAATADIDKLETVIVTAQKREENIQLAPLAITALTGADIADRKLLSAEDISHSVVGLSFTATSPQAFELNIRGVTNTRLTAPTADQSVSTFIDDVYVSRSGSINSAFYDVDRVEVARGPQGVLLGKNVSGGALSVISAPPKFDPGASVSVDLGNYELHQATGYITGPLADGWAGRLSFQTIDHAGYAFDLLHDQQLENLNSVQGRAQLLYQPSDSDLRVHLIVDYDRDSNNGINRVATPSTDNTGLPFPANCQPAPCFQPWSTARSIISGIVGGLGPRESFASWPTFAGDSTPTNQGLLHENSSAILKIEKDVVPDVRLTSVTGYRGGHANTFYDQGGVGPDNPYAAQVLPKDPFLFEEPVYFQETVSQVSEELRLASTNAASRLDWIAGIYLQDITVHQFNRFYGDSIVLPTLCGQSDWDDHGKNSDYAAFAKVGFAITDMWKLDIGLRYTHDKKSGTQVGTAVSTNCPHQPNKAALEIAAAEAQGLTPAQAQASVATLTPLGAYPGFSTPYGQSWSKVTPQGTLTFKPNDGLMSYLTVSQGYKGGGFQNDSSSAQVAALAYNPETVTNYELGVKWTLFDGHARWNTAIFDMEYKNLQVEQTIGGTCLCNIINNAAQAQIRGIETEFQMQATHWLYFYVSGSYLRDIYKEFVDATGLNDAGHQLQRTPKYQAAGGFETNTSIGSWPDALKFRVSFKEQGKMYWSPDNYTYEDQYGILDARITLVPPHQVWTVSAWGKNLTNQLYRTSIIAIFGDEISSYGAPRTFGVNFTAKL